MYTLYGKNCKGEVVHQYEFDFALCVYGCRGRGFHYEVKRPNERTPFIPDKVYDCECYDRARGYYVDPPLNWQRIVLAQDGGLWQVYPRFAPWGEGGDDPVGFFRANPTNLEFAQKHTGIPVKRWGGMTPSEQTAVVEWARERAARKARELNASALYEVTGGVAVFTHHSQWVVASNGRLEVQRHWRWHYDFRGVAPVLIRSTPLPKGDGNFHYIVHTYRYQ